MSIHCCVAHHPKSNSRLEQQHPFPYSFPLLIIASFGRAWQTHSFLLQAVSASLTLISRWLAEMAGQWYWISVRRSARAVDRHLHASSHRPLRGCLGMSHTIVAGFQSKCSKRTRRKCTVFSRFSLRKPIL